MRNQLSVSAGRRVARRPRPAHFATSHAHFWCDSEDGVRIAGSVLGPPASPALVLVHGFMGCRAKPKARLLADELAKRFRVFAFDLRGHGGSTGECTGGATEHLDVEAVVSYARRRGHDRIVTVGWSLGGIAVIAHAAKHGRVDAVVAISTPAGWAADSAAVRRTTWMFTSPVGRAIVREVTGTRISLRLDAPEPPAAAIAKIERTPVLIVHGSDDHFFGPRSGRELYEAANEPKRLLLFERFGHAEDGFTPAFAQLLSEEVAGLLASARRL